MPEEQYTKENLNFSRLYNDNILSTYEHLDRYFEPFIINPCLSNIITLLASFSTIRWNDFIDILQNPLLCHYYNYFYENKTQNKQDNFFLKVLNEESPNNTIALAFLNTIHSINRHSQADKNKAIIISKKLAKSLDKLSEQRKMYWLGILLSNYEYSLNKEFADDFESILQKQLGKSLLELKRLPKDLIKGLKSSPRDCNIRHLKVYNLIYKQNKKLAFTLAEEILKDYQTQLLEKDDFHQPFSEKYAVSYTNAVIEAIVFLAYNKKNKIYSCFDKLFDSLILEREAFKYNFSDYLKTKRALIHLFCVVFIVFQNLENNRIKINEQKVKKYFSSFMEYINRYLRNIDDDLEACFENVFKLDIFKQQRIVEEEIKHIYNLPFPEFKLLSILLKFSQENKFTNEVKAFICEYFYKYHKFWDNYKIKNWISICINLKNREEIMICLNMLPEWEQNKYKEILEKHNMI